MNKINLFVAVGILTLSTSAIAEEQRYASITHRGLKPNGTKTYAKQNHLVLTVV